MLNIIYEYVHAYTIKEGANAEQIQIFSEICGVFLNDDLSFVVILGSVLG